MKKRLSDMEKKQIEQLTTNLLAQFRDDTIPASYYVDIVALARFFGFRVGESKKLSDKQNGFIAISKDKKALLIGVNYYLTWEEKRFIIAHELAHYFLHYKDKELNKSVFVMHSENVKGKNNIENDADFFAACILMPRKEFETAYMKNKNDCTYDDLVDKLESLFRTPRESIERRIKELL